METLSKELLAEVQAAILTPGCSIDMIVEILKLAGKPRSRSAVGRYTKSYTKLVKRQRELQAMADAFGKDINRGDDAQTRLLVQMATSRLNEALLQEAEEESVELDWKENHFMARAVKDVLSAAKIEAEREASIRKNEREKAVAIVASVGKRTGASAETIDTIKRELLGITK